MTKAGRDPETGRAETDPSWRVETSPPKSSLRMVQGCAPRKGAMPAWALFSLQVMTIPSTKIFWQMTVKGFGEGASHLSLIHTMGLTGLGAALARTQISVPRWWWIRGKFYQRSQEGSSRIKHRWSRDVVGTGQPAFAVLHVGDPRYHLNVQIQGKWSSMNHLHRPSPTPLPPFERNHTLKDILRASENVHAIKQSEKIKMKTLYTNFLMCICITDIHIWK